MQITSPVLLCVSWPTKGILPPFPAPRKHISLSSGGSSCFLGDENENENENGIGGGGGEE